MAGEVAVMDISQASLGVRTRARTLALQRLKKSSTSPAPDQERGSYLQLRSRRLEKSPPVVSHHHDSNRHGQDQQQEERSMSDGSCGQNRSPNSISRVRTRARTLALQRLKKSSTSPAPDQERGSYLQLRSRRLEKSPPVVSHHHDSNRHGQDQQQEERSMSDGSCGQNRSPNSISRVRVGGGGPDLISEMKKECEFGSQDIEASFGENILDFEARERGTRESTPCSLIRDSQGIRTPGSTTGPTSSSRD